ncbi:hypothetical protein DICVIV_13865 [Dictyocaulus viviparus]|uniref:Uncharacterized protein n=1 Tax=Dictyocaulus viviparus TaxID=29172 RepID=A0A0D8X8X9_DICVI|nr:hypothetical protein DICVIV_13865 [Dictyocaulus viviparus]
MQGHVVRRPGQCQALHHQGCAAGKWRDRGGHAGVYGLSSEREQTEAPERNSCTNRPVSSRSVVACPTPLKLRKRKKRRKHTNPKTIGGLKVS